MSKEPSTWINSRILSKYFFRDALHGLLINQHLRKKSTRRILFAALALGYGFYLYMNFAEAANLRGGLAQQTQELVGEMNRQLTASLITMNSLWGALIALAVFLTFTLTSSSLYISRTMAFSPREVSIAQRTVKLASASSIFAALFIIEVSAITLAQAGMATYLGMSILSYVVFLTAFLVTDLLLTLASSATGRAGRILFAAVVFFLLAGLIYAFFDVKFRVDQFLAQSVADANQLIVLALMISALVLVLALAVSMHPVFDMRVRDSSVFIHLPMAQLLHSAVLFPVAAFMRSKLFVILFGIDVCAVALIMFKYGFHESVSIASFVMGSFTFAAVRYGDTTQSIRPMLKAFRWNPFIEAVILIGVYAILLAPSIFFSTVGEGGIDTILTFLGLFFAAVSIGFLFPRSGGSMNETVSLILFIAIVVLLALSLQIKGLIAVIDGALLLVMLALMKMETEKML